MTPAVRLLERAGIAHQVITYHHDPGVGGYGIEAAAALGVTPERVFKTLVAVVDRSQHVVGVVPVNTLLDLKALAKAAGAKKAAMAEREAAERLTGYVLGGISPLGQKKRLPTFVHLSAADMPTMYVSGGRRGLEIELAPSDLLDALDAQLAAIATR